MIFCLIHKRRRLIKVAYVYLRAYREMPESEQDFTKRYNDMARWMNGFYSRYYHDHRKHPISQAEAIRIVKKSI